MSVSERITLVVNGASHTRDVEVRKHLGDFLRIDLGLTGSHLGCEHGVCGACTVIVDGLAVRSCLMLAVQADGSEVVTVEGLSKPGEAPHPLQQAFRDQHGLQCGFCTPGMLTTLAVFLQEHPDAGETAIREAISGNICRCTGYQSIVEAALQAGRAIGGRS